MKLEKINNTVQSNNKQKSDNQDQSITFLSPEKSSYKMEGKNEPFTHYQNTKEC